MARTLRYLHQDTNGGIRRWAFRSNGVDQEHIDRVEHAERVQIALRLVERVLLEDAPRPHRAHATNGPRVHVTQSPNVDRADAQPRTGLHLQLDFRLQDPGFRVKVSQHFGIRIAAVAQPRDAHRLPLMNSKGRIDIAGRAQHRRVHHRVHVPALTVEENQPDDIAAELDLVEVALLPESQPAHVPLPRPPARLRRGDGALERVVIECTVTDERQAPNYPLLLLSGKDGCRRVDGEQQTGYDSQLT